jgi:hypothetical protein
MFQKIAVRYNLILGTETPHALIAPRLILQRF